MYFKFTKLQSWSKRSGSSRRRFKQSFPKSTHPFRAGELNPKHSRFSRLPALRDSACWSVK